MQSHDEPVEEIEENVIFKHPFKLESTYKKYEGNSQFVTNFKSTFRECLDYIWYDSKFVSLKHLRKLPTISELER